jgi:hypothetical protein
LVVQALTEGLQRGLITLNEISGLRRHERLPAWFDELLTETGS